MPHHFKTFDGKLFEVEADVTRHFTNLDKILASDANKDGVITLSRMHAPTLERIIEWCRHHKDDAPVPMAPVDESGRPIGPNRPVDSISNWDAKFILLERPALFELLNVSGVGVG